MTLLSRVRNLLPVSRGELVALQHENESLERRLRAARPTASGVEIDFGRFDYEHNQKLTGTERWLTLDKMESDPAIKGALRAMILPLQNAEWSIQAASDDPRDQEIAEFCEANLLRRQTEKFGRDYWVRTPWEAQRLPEVMAMLRDGFSAFHLTTRTVGAKRVFDRIQWIEPHTIDGIEPWVIDDEDNLLAINRNLQYPTGQIDYSNEASRLHVDTLALYVHDFKGARYEGRAFVRSMYGAWFRKEAVQRWRAIWAQKSGSPAPYGTYPASWDQAARDDFSRFMRSVRGTAPAEAYGLFPRNAGEEPPEIKFAGADLDVERGMNDLVDSENAEIARAGSMKSRMLGETQSGSRALGESQLGMEMLEIQALAKTLASMECHGVNNVPGLIERLVDMNYHGVKTYPTLTCSKIDPDENLKHLDKLVAAVSSGLVPKHPDLRRAVTEMFGVKLPEEAFEVDEEPIAAPPPANGGPVDPSTPEDQPDDRAALAARRETIAERLRPLLEPTEGGRPRSGGRFPSKLEARVLNLAEIQETFRTGERDVLQAFRGLRDEMVDDLMDRLRRGKITTRNLTGQRRSKFRREAGSIKRLLPTVRQIGQAGGRQVVEEIERGTQAAR